MFCGVEIIVFVKTGGQDQGDVAVPAPITTHLLASFDLLSATFEGLSAEVSVLATKNQIISFIYTILTNETFNEMVSIHYLIHPHHSHPVSYTHLTLPTKRIV